MGNKSESSVPPLLNNLILQHMFEDMSSGKGGDGNQAISEMLRLGQFGVQALSREPSPKSGSVQQTYLCSTEATSVSQPEGSLDPPPRLVKNRTSMPASSRADGDSAYSVHTGLAGRPSSTPGDQCFKPSEKERQRPRWAWSLM